MLRGQSVRLISCGSLTHSVGTVTLVYTLMKLKILDSSQSASWSRTYSIKVNILFVNISTLIFITHVVYLAL
jgi:hypothetical protein